MEVLPIQQLPSPEYSSAYDKDNKNRVGKPENEVSDISDNVPDVSGDSVSDSLGDVGDDNMMDNFDKVTSIDNTRDIYPDDKVGEIIDIVTDLANETSDVLNGDSLPDVGLTNDEILGLESDIVDNIQEIAKNIVDDLVDDVDKDDKDDKEGSENEKD